MRSGVWIVAAFVALAGCSDNNQNETEGPDLSGAAMQEGAGSGTTSSVVTGTPSSTTGPTNTKSPSSTTSTGTTGTTSSTSTSTTATATGTSTPTSTATSITAGPNRAPTITLTATPATGIAPLDVVLRIEASDPDGDTLSWSLDWDGDGTSDASGSGVPVERTHSYATGSYTATATVQDGRGGTASATVDITVAVPYAGLSKTIYVTSGCNACDEGPDGSGGLQEGWKGSDINWVSLPPEAAGHAFSVSSGRDPVVAFTTSCALGAELLALHDNAGAESGTVPAGAGCMFVWKTGLLGASFEVTVS